MRWYSPRDWVEEEEKEEEGDRVTKPLSKSSEQSSHQRDPLASLTTSERLGDWGDEAEDWDVILGGAQTQTKDEVQAGSEVKVEQATSKEVPGLSASKRVSVNLYLPPTPPPTVTYPPPPLLVTFPLIYQS